MSATENTGSGGQALRRAAIAIAIFLFLTALLYLLAPADFYPWAKAVHVIAVISWMAGMLYLPRLFVYHAAAEPGSQQAKTFEVMEHRLLTYIMMPAMAVTWILGIVLMLQGGFLTAGWLHAKLVLVLGMSALNGVFGRWARDFAIGRNTRTQKFYRIINEIPTILMIVIVILVVVKPF